MKYTHEERAAIHEARAAKARVRADAAAAKDRARLTAVYADAIRELGSAIGQTDPADIGPLDAAATKLRDLHARSLL